MTFTLTLALAVLVVVALFQVTRLLSAVAKGRRGEHHAVEDAELIALEDERERCLYTLKELEQDLEMRKISRQDYDELRASWEERAVVAIRRLRERQDKLEAAGGRAEAVVALLAALALISVGHGSALAQELPPGHPQIGGMGGRAARISGDVEVKVTHTNPAGVTLPAPSVRVFIRAEERLPGREGEMNLVNLWEATTGADGIARFGAIRQPQGSRLRALALKGGTYYEASDPTGSRFAIHSYETTTDVSALALKVDAQLTLEEGSLRATLAYTITNGEPVAVDLATREEPVYLPLLAPVAMGGVVARGFLPVQAPKHIATFVRPSRGRVEHSGGGIRYRGLVMPGEETVVRVSYPLDYPGDDMQVGFLSEQLPISALLLNVQHSERFAPKVRLSLPAVGASGAEGTSRFVVLKTVAPLPVGQDAILTFRHLPVHGVMGRRLAAGLLVTGGFILVLALLRGHKQSRTESIG